MRSSPTARWSGRRKDPFQPDGGLAVLRGSLAPNGAVVKTPGIETLRFDGRARVFECEEDCFAAVTARQVGQGDVLVIRNEGPRGGPGMREMLAVTAAIKGAGFRPPPANDNLMIMLKAQDSQVAGHGVV